MEKTSRPNQSTQAHGSYLTLSGLLGKREYEMDRNLADLVERASNQAGHNADLARKHALYSMSIDGVDDLLSCSSQGKNDPDSTSKRNSRHMKSELAAIEGLV